VRRFKFYLIVFSQLNLQSPLAKEIGSVGISTTFQVLSAWVSLTEGPTRENSAVVHGLTTTDSPDVQRQTLERYFTTDAAFDHVGPEISRLIPPNLC
jgi:hypothetical protein